MAWSKKALQIEESESYQRRDLRVQRVGWAVLALKAIAALLGGLGQGTLAWAEQTSAEATVHVRYERLVRRHSPARLEFTIAPGLAGADGRVRLWLDRSYADELEITGIQPEPADVSVTPTLLIYQFAVADGGRPVLISFSVQYDRAGMSRASAGVLPRGTVQLGQFVFP
jgi:hypothetical protein